MQLHSFSSILHFFNKVIEELPDVKNLNIKFAFKIKEFDKLIIIDCKGKKVKEGGLDEEVDVWLELTYEVFKNLYEGNLDVMFALNKKLIIPYGNVKHVMQIVKTIPKCKKIFEEISKNEININKTW